MALSRSQMARLDVLFEQALGLNRAERERWIQELGPEDLDLEPALRRALLVEQTAEGDPLATLPKLAPIAAMNPGDLVGPYRLMRPLGSGGMAQVWLAQRADGAFKREVALKMPALGGQRRDLADRFAVERDILAGLEHPNIARFYDAGVSQDGKPYLALEYVPGKSLATWADNHRLDLEERIELFQQVLDAVQYAHDRGVLHRDIKPSNVLVTDSGQVRLLDFGVAKLLEKPSEVSLTQVYGRAFTPDYASPEHIQGGQLQAGSDVYSLGVMLYEILAGSRPYRTTAGDPAGLLEETANRTSIDKPSTQVAPEAAAARSTTQKKLARRLRGDLDAIVLKALARHPKDRYASAAALADDLQCYLRRIPVQARNGRPTYLLGRFVLRHRTGVATGAAVAALVAAMFGYEAMGSRTGLGSAQSALGAPGALQSAGAAAIDDKSIAVLPFVDMSEKKDQEYFSDGLSEELIDRLSHSQDLRVISRTSSFYFKGKQATIGEIAKTLHVSHVLEGSVRKSGRALRITAQLIRTVDGSHLWSQTYDRNLADVFKLQEEIAETVATSLKGALTSTAQNQSAPTNVEAYNLLLQGVFFYRRFNRADSYRAVEFYQKAIDLDPNYALAWARLAQEYFEQALNGWTHMADGSQKARAAAARAVKLDPTLELPHVVLGRISLFFDWDWSAVRDEFQRACDLDPDDLYPAAGLAWLRGGMYGRMDEEIAIRKKAAERDPLDARSLMSLTTSLYLAGRNEESLATARRLLLVNPSGAGVHTNMAISLLQLGRPDEALAAAQKEADEDSRLATLPIVYWALGRKAESDAALKQLEEKYAVDDAYSIAQMHAYRGETDSAFQWLDRAYRQRESGMPDIRRDPLLQNLHRDQRYKALLVKMKLDGDPPMALN